VLEEPENQSKPQGESVSLALNERAESETEEVTQGAMFSKLGLQSSAEGGRPAFAHS